MNKIIGALVVGCLALACGLGTYAVASGGNQTGRVVVRDGETAGQVGAEAATEGAKELGLGAGTWEVPGEVKPGTYVSTAPEDSIGGCYWARLKSFGGGGDHIIANGIMDPGARGRITVKKTDKGLELSGDCLWKKATR